MPDVANLESFPSYRLQQVYDATNFEALGDGPFEITRVDWRPDGTVAKPLTYSAEEWLMSLSTVAIEPGNLSSRFEDNLGADAQVVSNGAVTIDTNNEGREGGPKLFDYGLELDAPFVFDPSKGNLLMDLTVRNGDGPVLLDFSNGENRFSSFYWTGALGPDSELAATTPEEVGGQWGGHAIQFTMNRIYQETPFFWDDFDRDTIGTDELAWDGNSAGNYSIQDGSLIVEPTADNFPGVFVPHPTIENYSIHTQFRFLGEDQIPPATNPWIGIWTRDRQQESGDGGYWGGVGADGILYLGRTPEGTTQADIRDQVQVFSPEEIRENDIHYQMDAEGEQISIRTWLDGMPRPDDPQLTMTDAEFSVSALSGLFENPSAELTGFAIRSFALLPLLPGDFNANDVLDSGDLEFLAAEVQSGNLNENLAFDLDLDRQVDAEDIGVWISDLFGTLPGDANLDREVNFEDFLLLSRSFGEEAPWSSGDFDGNGTVSFPDFLLLANNFGTSAALTPVPEPSASNLAMVGLVLFAARRRLTV